MMNYEINWFIVNESNLISLEIESAYFFQMIPKCTNKAIYKEFLPYKTISEIWNLILLMNFSVLKAFFQWS